MECSKAYHVLCGMWTVRPIHASSLLQGLHGVSGDAEAVNDLGPGSGWPTTDEKVKMVPILSALKGEA